MKLSSAKDIRTIYQQSQEAAQAIALYRLPNTTTINCTSGSISRTLKDGQQAFAFAAFDSSQRPYYIIPDTSLAMPSTALTKNKKQKSTARKDYMAFVNKIIQEIKDKRVKKVVAARLLAIDRPDTFDPLAFFYTLCDKYSSAFISLVHIPDIGLWIGASPEILVSESTTRLTVYSLAGTRQIEDSNDWNEKELYEQSIVTDFIKAKLDNVCINPVSQKGPVTHSAGKLKHLLTIFSAKNKGASQWRQVAKALHPTPAVGGLPQRKALTLIKENESFDRSFYAGYIGPVNKKGKTDLFVNLRCLEVTDRQLLFYAGCGITADSDPSQEWLESERKIDVLKSLL